MALNNYNEGMESMYGYDGDETSLIPYLRILVTVFTHSRDPPTARWLGNGPGLKMIKKILLKMGDIPAIAMLVDTRG